MWLDGEEVRKSVIGAFFADGCGQVVYDTCREMVREEEMEDGEFSVLETASQSFRGDF